MAAELSKAYQPGDVEKKWYQRWTEDQCFRGDENSDAEAYSIVIPPPNVTGILHLGHVLNNTIQDILARRARQQGKAVLWLPGTDHAGIATQSKVEKELRKNQNLTRHDLGREKFLDEVWDWKDKHGGIIIEQLKRLGCSCDWSRERFTMDEKYSRWVSRIFVDLFHEGLIYRGKRMVNWCPKSLTALSDEEVIMKPQKSKLYYMRYEIADEPGRFVEIATTRPETIMGDSGVAVNPKDPRYADLVGRKAVRPFPRAEIPIVADEHIDPEFGTGVLKVTPAHDHADFDIGLRHDLEVIDVLNPDGTLNELAGEDFVGMDRFKARTRAVELLEEMGLLVKVEEHENNVGYSERADVPIEPRISMQWFLRYPCVQEATKAVETGDITFRPERWKKTYLHWLDNIQDWCISRQLWWGHQIPVWYKKELVEDLKSAESLDVSTVKSGDIYCGIEPPSDPGEWVQDTDVLDTWFSSWLWPFATMTPSDDDHTQTVQKFYPTADLVTGPDIIFFWVARMIMAGYRFMDELPFQNVFFTSIIRDRQGRKLSKSLGNSPDPLDIIDSLGADALRYSIMRQAPIGTDVRFTVEKRDDQEIYPQVEEGRNFANKLWNACRYRQMQGTAEAEPSEASIYAVDILSKLHDLEANVEKAYEDYRFNEVAQLLYDFVWSEFCDWYLESTKYDLAEGAEPSRKAATLRTIDTVLSRSIQLLNPFMPHITEELWEKLGYGEEGDVLMQELMPEESVLEGIEVEPSRSHASDVYHAVGRMRNLKAEYNLAANRNVKFILIPSSDWVEAEAQILQLLAGAGEVSVEPDYEASKGEPAALTNVGRVYMPLAGLIDVDAEKSRLGKELDKVEKELQKVDSKLGNSRFTDNAPEAVVNEMRERKTSWVERRDQLQDMMSALG